MQKTLTFEVWLELNAFPNVDPQKPFNSKKRLTCNAKYETETGMQKIRE